MSGMGIEGREYPAPGKYIGLGGGRFRVRCTECLRTADGSWGQSGSAIAATRIRALGWHMTGLTNRARWHCGCFANTASGLDGEGEGGR